MKKWFYMITGRGKHHVVKGIPLLQENEYFRLKNTGRYIHTETELYGKKICVTDAPTFLSSFNEIFKEEIYKFDCTKNDIVIMDCGANIGLATIYFKRKFPMSKIYSYEPDPQIFEALKNNINSFGYSDIELINAAVSTKDGCVNFHREGGHSGMIKNFSSTGELVVVKCVRLKKELQKFDEINFLKIDIEGHEIEILPDITSELKKVKYLFLEYHSFIGQEQKLDELINIIKNAGFRYYLKESYNKKFPFIEREIFLKMDLLVNLFCYRD